MTIQEKEKITSNGKKEEIQHLIEFDNYSIYFRVVFLGIISALAIFIRIPMFKFISGDFYWCLNKWYIEMQIYDWSYFKGYSADYSPAYLYFMFLCSRLRIPEWIDGSYVNGQWIANNRFSILQAIKSFDIIFEFMAAFYISKIVALKYKGRPFIQDIAFTVVLFSPIVLLNGSTWAQCDIIYASFAIASLYYLMKGKNLAACILLGVSFSFKLQMIFILPIYFIYFMRNKLPWYYLLCVPGVFIISILPAIAMGANPLDMLTIYLFQSGNYQYMVMNFPNIYVWLSTIWGNTSNTLYDCFLYGGLIVALGSTLILCLVIIYNKIHLTKDNVIWITYFFALFIPFILPGMHERYGMLFDLLAIIFCFYFIRYAYIGIITTIISLGGYITYLFNDNLPIPFPFLVLAYAAVLYFLIYMFIKRNKDDILEPQQQI